MYNKVNDIMQKFLQDSVKKQNECFENSILSCGYQFDEVMQYAKQKKRFRIYQISRSFDQTDWYFRDSYKSQTYHLMSIIRESCSVTLRSYENKVVKHETVSD